MPGQPASSTLLFACPACLLILVRLLHMIGRARASVLGSYVLWLSGFEGAWGVLAPRAVLNVGYAACALATCQRCMYSIYFETWYTYGNLVTYQSLQRFYHYRNSISVSTWCAVPGVCSACADSEA